MREGSVQESTSWHVCAYVCVHTCVCLDVHVRWAFVSRSTGMWEVCDGCLCKFFFFISRFDQCPFYLTLKTGLASRHHNGAYTTIGLMFFSKWRRRVQHEIPLIWMKTTQKQGSTYFFSFTLITSFKYTNERYFVLHFTQRDPNWLCV